MARSWAHDRKQLVPDIEILEGLSGVFEANPQTLIGDYHQSDRVQPWRRVTVGRRVYGIDQTLLRTPA